MERQEKVDISVQVLTYYHEKYIAQCLDSILAQETELRYEILVGDDASQDRTPEIIREYAARYPDIIFPTLRKENLGASRNSGSMRAGGTLQYWRGTTSGWTGINCKNNGIFWSHTLSTARAAESV